MKRVAAMMLILILMVPLGTTLAQDGGEDDDLGILDCLPPTPEYLLAVMPNGMPVFALFNECGVFNLEQPFTLIYSSTMVSFSGLGQSELAYNVTPYPVLTGSWNDTNPYFLNLGDDTDIGGSHGMQLVGSTSPATTVAPIHTYNNPDDGQNLMGELLRRLYQNDGFQMGQVITLVQVSDGWQTTVELELVDARLVEAGLFQQADQVNSFTGRIEINLELIGYQPISSTPTIIFVGCYESASSWWGNRVLFSFALKSISVQPLS